MFAILEFRARWQQGPGALIHASQLLPSLLLITSVTACSAIEMENEREVAFSEVPEAVLAAARGAVPGITVMEAEMEVEEGRTIYEFEGKVGNRNYEVEVDAEGEVLEIEEIGFFSWL